MAFLESHLGSWLVSFLTKNGRSWLTSQLLGAPQERALHAAARAAVRQTARTFHPDDDEQAAHVELVITEVFGRPLPETPLADQATMLEALQAGVAAQLAVLDDADLTDVDQSAADVLGVPTSMLAQQLTSDVMREIIVRGAQGGPLAALATQLNHDMTHLQGLRTEGKLGELADEVRQLLVRLDRSLPASASPTALPELPPVAFPAQLTPRKIPISSGLQHGTLLAIEVRPHRELTQAMAVATQIVGPSGAPTIPVPARMFWHPGRETAATIAQGAAKLISVARVGPLPPGAVMNTPDQDLPWTLFNGQWRVKLELTALGYPAVHLTATFSVSPARGFLAQAIEWLQLT
jgi:hypothetical protein